MAEAKSKAGGANGTAVGNGHKSENQSEAKVARGGASSGSIQDKIIAELKHAYEMELETVINYLSNSVHLDGLLAQEVRESLKNDITEELGHGTRIAERLKILNADVPGSLALKFGQKGIQPPANSTDVLSVVKGVIEAESEAIAQYEKLIDLADDADDYVTEDMCIQILAQEQHHKREFEGFLKSLKK